MAKVPKDPKEIFPDVIADYSRTFGDNLVSIILYGSAAGDGYRSGKSDINFMIVLTEKGMEALDSAIDDVQRWRKRKVATPLFVTEDYVNTSLDVFPIEYLNIKQNHILVYGKDILKDLQFQSEHIRLQCEREIKGKLLLLREAYLETAGKVTALKDVIRQSISAFVAIFQALAFLKDIELSENKRSVITHVGDSLGLNSSVFLNLLDIKEEKIKPGADELKRLFKDYLIQVRELSKQVDTLGG